MLLAAAALPHAFARGNSVSAAIRSRIEGLAREHSVCSAAFVTLSARTPNPPEFVAACRSSTRLAARSVFQAASLSKPVVAYGVLRLVLQAKLDLDASVVRYLPDGYVHRSNPLQIGRPPITDMVAAAELAGITIRSLLNHSSGLPNWSDGPLSFGFNPGTRWQYSGEGYALLQRIVEVVTGDELDTFLARQIFEPLGMESSSFRWNKAVGDRLVPGTSASGQPRQLRFPEPMAAASLYTSAPDYAAFLAALLNDAPALRLTTAVPVSASSAPPLDWGLGWGIERSQGGPCIWQWGSNPGYRAFAMASVDSGDGFVLFTNSERGLSLAEPLADLVIPGAHPAFRFRMLR